MYDEFPVEVCVRRSYWSVAQEVVESAHVEVGCGDLVLSCMVSCE